MMKRSFTFILCLLILLNTSLAQTETNVVKSLKRIKNSKIKQNRKGIAEITGSIISLHGYTPGATAVLSFQINFTSPDAEFLDGLSMTFPTGMTPIVTGTSDPITSNTGCGTATGQLNPISGQTISWGNITTPSNCGYLDTGTYVFSVGVTIGAITGVQHINYTAFGDGYGVAPNSFTGNIIVNQASTNDVGIASENMAPFYQTSATVSPMVTVKNFGTTTQSFDVSIIFNNGTSNVYGDTVNVSSLASGATQQVIFANWTAVNGNYIVSTQTLLAGDTVTSNDSSTFNFAVATTFPAYAWNTSSSAINLGPVTISIPDGQLSSLGTDTSAFMAGADFVNNQWFGASSDANSKIYTINKTTGVKTLVGLSGVAITGLTYDVTTGNLFASVYVSADSSNSLYTINTVTGLATLVGSINSTGEVIGIASNNAGDIYGITLKDSLISINKTTGAATFIGPLGININYAQDIAFDRDNNILYGTLYTTTGILAKINTTTGAASTLATIGAEVDGFAIPYTFTLPDNDMMVQSITPIENGCGLSAAQTIVARVFNNGNNPQSNIPVYYAINGGSHVTGTVAGPIAPAAYVDYSFTQTADLSAFGTFNITVCTNLTGDGNTNNDCNSITVTNIQPSTIPYTMGFESNEDLSGWKVVDINGDSSTWKLVQSTSLAYTGTGYARYTYNSTTAADDWMFTKCINLSAGTNYEVTFWCRVGAEHPEKLKVAIGTAQNATAMSQVINDLGNLNDTIYSKHTSAFTVPTTGTYYVGWYAYSNANEWFIAVDDIKIDIANGIENNTTNNEINLYPNPAKDQLNIRSYVNIENIKVFNAIGQVIVNLNINTQSHVLNTSNLNYGIYYIQLETKKGIVTKKFVIAK